MIQYLFRRPVFPLLIASDTVVGGAVSEAKLNSRINELEFNKSELFQIIDASGEGWSYESKNNLISLLTVDKKWTKKSMIEFYNNSIANDEGSEKYVVKSLSNRKLAVIVREIALMASQLTSSATTLSLVENSRLTPLAAMYCDSDKKGGIVSA